MLLSYSAVYNKEEDIATYTIQAVDDPKTLNKLLYIRSPANSISMNDLTTLWENKCGKKLERVYVPEEQVLKDIKGETVVLWFSAFLISYIGYLILINSKLMCLRL